MWLFTKDRSAFPYQVDATTDEVVGDWVLRPCKNTKTNVSCSAWVLDCSRGSNPALIERGKALIKRMKTLRHPNVITYLDSHESADSVTLITEEALPLKTYLRRSSDSGNLTYLTSWGIYQIAKALDFFNKDAKLHHNNVRMSSIFVTPAGDWKLGGLDFVQPQNETPNLRPPSVDIYWPPDKRRVDSWGLGCLIWEVYNTGGLDAVDDLRRFGNIPQALIPQYSELIHPKSMRRSTISDFLSRASLNTGFFDNFYVKTLLFLEEIQIKDKEEKLTFLSGLADNVNNFPDDVAKFKILPHLMHCMQYGGAGAEVLTPLLKLGKLLDAVEFEQKVLPCLVKLFSSPDRATRVKLLEQLPSFAEHLPEKCVNEQIFPPVSQGFIDSNPVVREATIRAMVPLSEKLNSRILNETLPRSLTQLQVKDDQGGIRANASICLVKIAGRMSPKTRQGPLLNTFLKCTRDPYPPARRMAVTALATTLSFYTLKDSACKILPCLAFLTVDPVREVRDETFKSISVVVGRLERASESAEVAEEEDKTANSGAGIDSSTMASSAVSAGSAALAWTNWAVSAISSKFAKTNMNPSTTGPTTDAGKPSPSVGQSIEPDRDRGRAKDNDFVQTEDGKKTTSSYDWDGKKKGGDGWEVDDEQEDEGAWVSLNSVGNKDRSEDEWDSANDFFEEIGKPAPSAPVSKKVSNSSAGGRKAMKLGKKIPTEYRASNFEVRANKPAASKFVDTKAAPRSEVGAWDSWAAEEKKTSSLSGSQRSESPSNDWGNSWGMDAKKPAMTNQSSKHSATFNEWDSTWSKEENKQTSAKQKTGGMKLNSTSMMNDWDAGQRSSGVKASTTSTMNDWDSSWGNEDSSNDWGSSWSEKPSVRQESSERKSPAKDSWDSSWGSGSRKDTGKAGSRTKSSNDGWDAW